MLRCIDDCQDDELLLGDIACLLIYSEANTRRILAKADLNTSANRCMVALSIDRRHQHLCTGGRMSAGTSLLLI